MKSHLRNGRSITIYRSVIFTALLFMAASILPLLTRAQTSASITVTNNSAVEIHHIYLSPPDTDDWGPDQLNGVNIAAGASYTLSNISCSGAGVKVIAEDQNGCFLTYTISCSSNDTWTITDSSARDCGN